MIRSDKENVYPFSYYRDSFFRGIECDMKNLKVIDLLFKCSILNQHLIDSSVLLSCSRSYFIPLKISHAASVISYNAIGIASNIPQAEI